MGPCYGPKKTRRTRKTRKARRTRRTRKPRSAKRMVAASSCQRHALRAAVEVLERKSEVRKNEIRSVDVNGPQRCP